MKFKRIENDLIWENYRDVVSMAPEENQYPAYGSEDEDAEMVLSMAPTDVVEPELEMESDNDEISEEDDDNEIVLHALRKVCKRAEHLQELCKANKLEAWMIAKIVKAEDYISDVWDQLDDVADFANDGFEDSDNISL